MLRALALAGAVLGGAAAPAQAQLFDASSTKILKVVNDFAKDGRIDPCKHSEATLRAALGPAEQLNGTYPGAIRRALRARARGDCSPQGGAAAGSATATPTATATGTATPAAGATTTPTPAAGATTTPTPAAAATTTPTPTPAAAAPAPSATPSPAPAAATTTSDGDRAVVLLALGILCGVLAALVLLFGLLRRLGVADDRLAPIGHSWREARWRAGGTWADFRDWVRTGR
jgi:hypothetical protein